MIYFLYVYNDHMVYIILGSIKYVAIISENKTSNSLITWQHDKRRSHERQEWRFCHYTDTHT